MGKLKEFMELPAVSAIGSAGLSFLGNIAGAAISRSWENEDWSKRESALNYYQKQNELNGPSRLAQGLRNAGFSPAMAAGNFSPASVPNASATAQNIPGPNIDLLAAQQVASSTANTNVKTALDQNTLKRATDADNSANAQFRATLNFWKDNFPKDDMRYKAAEELLSMNDVFSLGSVEGTERAQVFRRVLSEVDRDEVANEFIKQVHKQKLVNGAAKSLAELDNWQLKHFIMEYAEMQARIANLGVNSELSKAQIGQVVAETAHIMEDTNLLHFKSFANLFANGEYRNGALVLLEQAAMTAAGLAPIASLGRVGRVATNRVAPTTQKAFNRLRGTTNPKGITGNSDF